MLFAGVKIVVDIVPGCRECCGPLQEFVGCLCCIIGILACDPGAGGCDKPICVTPGVPRCAIVLFFIGLAATFLIVVLSFTWSLPLVSEVVSYVSVGWMGGLLYLFGVMPLTCVIGKCDRVHIIKGQAPRDVGLPNPDVSFAPDASVNRTHGSESQQGERVVEMHDMGMASEGLPEHRMIAVTLPAEVTVGQELEMATPEGQLVKFVVPPGAQAGAVMQLQI
eukprot:gnl/MRDRNA2_/MRDRNA2_174735_c0_seq1.p1 gnl/MRDRNA2_/MRDRNA2_174735_c0~~gnl/MRDRNA2_/MRDRNA2_174735_c0_seq1.p1  ORF type:complete len:246 (-),score=27.70 gnl/MRDRNA2_/MRDRNA2_174735_c0_seq1:168-833(-)